MKIIKKQKYMDKIESGDPVAIKFKFAYPEILMLINTIVSKYLSKTDHIFLLNSIITVLREVVVNAQKANAKRIYFINNNLNISNPDDYNIGMTNFKKDVIGDFDALEKEILGSDFYVRMNFLNSDNGIVITVENNSPILQKELERVNFRIEKAIQYNDFTEAYEEISDDSEGAGLGIVLTILFLKNMGIDPKKFKIESDGRITKTSLEIPHDLRDSAITSVVKDQIVNDIEGIPTFPENIIQLMSLCDHPDSSIELIAKKIEIDPALATDVIKLSNSAGFITVKKIQSVSSAIMTIGLKNVKAILTVSNARKILDKRYKHFEHIWEHCNKTAFYARAIAIRFKLSGVVENAFMAGLLHDLGKIILLSTDLKVVDKISKEVKNRKIVTSTIMEEISIGISHSTIGKYISEKWNFPGFLVETIEHHHAPLNASEETKDLVSVVYLANMLCGIEDRKYYFYYLEESILERFVINDENKFNEFHQFMKDKYEDSKKL